MAVQVFADIEYLYIVTALFPSRYIKSSFDSILYTDVPSGVVVHAATVSVFVVFDVIVLICPFHVPDMILT
jgi:hypothetical protein